MTTIPPMPEVNHEGDTQGCSLDNLDELEAWGKRGWTRVQELGTRLNDYETRLSAVMLPDFKDWHQNNPAEHPEVAAWVITNLRENVAFYENDAEQCEAKVKELEIKYSELCKDIAEWHPVADCAQEIHDLRAKLEEAERDYQNEMRETDALKLRLVASAVSDAKRREQSDALAEALDYYAEPSNPVRDGDSGGRARDALTTYRDGR